MLVNVPSGLRTGMFGVPAIAFVTTPLMVSSFSTRLWDSRLRLNEVRRRRRDEALTPTLTRAAWRSYPEPNTTPSCLNCDPETKYCTRSLPPVTLALRLVTGAVRNMTACQSVLTRFGSLGSPKYCAPYPSFSAASFIYSTYSRPLSRSQRLPVGTVCEP